MINLTELENGNLLIEIVDKEDFAELLDKGYSDERHPLLDMLESARYLGNDWDAPCNLALTKMPLITYGVIYDSEDSDSPDDYEKYWGFPNYMIYSYLQILKDDGKVIFTKMN